MQEPRESLSVVMATYDDFHGVYFTVEALLNYHGGEVDEILVVDNNPDSKHGETTRNFINNVASPRVKYAPFIDVKGTANTRDFAIRSAASDIVVCTDPHVLFPPDSIKAVRRHFAANPDTRDLIQGPMLLDNGLGIHTHFDLSIWRGQMWGTWDTDPRGNGVEPFDIPAQGLGAFATLRKHWMGFNPEFRGFGGEEGYVHHKYRQDGRRTLCVPQFLWVHRFGRPDGVPYPLAVLDKVRNYVIGHKELNLPLTPIKEHFVGGGFVSALDWKDLSNGDYPKSGGCGACVGERFDTLEEWAGYVAGEPSDINEHVDRLRELSAGRRVVDVGHRNSVSSVALASNGPKSYTLIHPAQPPEYAHIARFLGKAGIPVELKISTTEIDVIPECDLLFLDTVHTADYVGRFLKENAGRVSDYIILHDTVIYGESGEGGGPGTGIMVAVREFLQTDRRWSVSRHYHNQYGLLVLVGNPKLKKPLPGIIRQAGNYAKALTAHVANGNKRVELAVYEQRLSECNVCESRNGEQCSECGCYLNVKALWESSGCPLMKW